MAIAVYFSFKYKRIKKKNVLACFSLIIRNSASLTNQAAHGRYIEYENIRSSAQ